jgi:NitT/TauT family transport system permease protein
MASEPTPATLGPSATFRCRRRLGKLLELGLSVGVFVALFAFWELAARLKWVNPMFASSPSRIYAAAIELFHEGEMPRHIRATAVVFSLGFALSALVGVPLGIAVGWFRNARRAFTPLISAFNTTPRIALMPLFIIWFGLGFGSKLAMVFVSAIFPLIVNMQVAMINIDGEYLQVGRAYGASEWQMFATIALPSSVPFLLTGLRMAAGRALLGVVTAEVFGGSEGLGFMIQYAGQTFQIETVFVCVGIIALAGIAMDRTLFAINSRVDSWRGGDA